MNYEKTWEAENVFGGPWFGLTKIKLNLGKNNNYTIFIVTVTKWWAFGVHIPSFFLNFCRGVEKSGNSPGS